MASHFPPITDQAQFVDEFRKELVEQFELHHQDVFSDQDRPDGERGRMERSPGLGSGGSASSPVLNNTNDLGESGNDDTSSPSDGDSKLRKSGFKKGRLGESMVRLQTILHAVGAKAREKGPSLRGSPMEDRTPTPMDETTRQGLNKRQIGDMTADQQVLVVFL